VRGSNLPLGPISRGCLARDYTEVATQRYEFMKATQNLPRKACGTIFCQLLEFDRFFPQALLA